MCSRASLQFETGRNMAKLQRIDSISDKSVQNIINSIDTVLFDVDGVLVHNKAVIPGSDDTIKKLRALGKNIGFVTNNSLYTVDRLLDNLAPFGATTDEIFNPNLSLVQYLKRINFQKEIYAVCPQTLKTLLREAGYKLVEYQDIWPTAVEENITSIKELSLKTLEVCKNVGAVLLDVDTNHCYGSIQVAQVILNRIEGVELLSGMCDDLAPIGDNLFFLCAQYCLDGMERWTGKTTIKVGKPSKPLADLVNAKYNISDPSRVLMIGDNVPTDIAFGVLAGYQTCLVLSGMWTEDQVHNWKVSENWKPNFVANKFADFLPKIKDM